MIINIVTVDGDNGEFWFDGAWNFKGFIHANDGYTTYYHRDVLKEFGITVYEEMVSADAMDQEQWEAFENECDDPSAQAKIVLDLLGGVAEDESDGEDV